ncbi:hypothetical protein L1987_30149 [Smallanthus sonchifolius]|uniref:Uncharacterized protein n=1 Tax=Smallanthus sonchifolius TaxID=185202 RepID=A0ACB9I1V2_9ASTR|nr:hypothetical protein L1987_30149 [Smallanthus sonchifolius]
MSAISITNNLVQHSKIKHIDIRYHFIRDQAEKKRIILTKVHTNEQYADLFTKPFDEARFRYLVESIVAIEFAADGLNHPQQPSLQRGIPQIQAKVDGKDITITEDTLRKHLKLQDEGAAISYSKVEYMRTFVSIGYTGNQNEYTIEKALMGPPWKFLCHTLLQFISQKRSGWHQVSSSLASAVHGMVSGQGFNLAHLIFEGVNVPLLSTMMKIQSTQGDSSAIPTDTDPTPSSSHIEQQSSSTVRTPVHTTKDAQAHKLFTPVLDVIVQLEQRASAPCQDDIPSQTTTISEVLIDLAASAPNPSSSPKKVHSGSTDRVNVERAVTTPGTTTNQEDSDNITKTLIMTTHSEGVSFETLFTERNPRCQENQGDGDAEARPKSPSSSKDSTTVDEDSLKLKNMELTARVAMLEAEVSKLRHQVSMHEAHQSPTVPTPSLVSVGTQTDATVYTDATKNGEIVTVEDDADSLEDWIQEHDAFQSSLFKPAFFQVHDLPDSVDEYEEISKDWKLVV